MLKFSEDTRVHQALFRHYDYLQDFPLNIRGKFIEDAVNLGQLETDDFLGFMAGYPVEEDSAGNDRFPLLTSDENQKISHYQLINPVIPWPQSIIGVNSGQVLGIHGVDVLMKDVGSCQLWWGDDVGILWEAILSGLQDRQDFEAIMNQVWGICEKVLQSHGVRKILTFNRDNEYDLNWYQNFLTRQGFQSVEGKEFAVTKNFL